MWYSNIFPHKKADILVLERVQNSFTRKVLIRSMGFKYSSIPDSVTRNKMLNLDSLEARRDRNDLILAHKILSNQTGLDSKDFFTTISSNTRGPQNKILLKLPKTSYRRNFFAYRAGSKYMKILEK